MQNDVFAKSMFLFRINSTPNDHIVSFRIDSTTKPKMISIIEIPLQNTQENMIMSNLITIQQ